MPRLIPHSPARRLFLLKIFAYLDYAFSVVGNAYLGMYMATIDLRLDQIFLVSVVSVVVAVSSQNLVSRLSDRKRDRMTFMILSRVFSACSIFIVAFIPTLIAVIASTILVNLISGEMVSAAVVYELVDQHVRTLPSGEALSVNKSREFAKYRLFGSIGWAWTAPFGGIAISTLNGLGGNPYLGYSVMFTVSGAGTLAMAGFLYYILNGYERENRDGHLEASSGCGVPRAESKFYFKPGFVMLVSSGLVFSIAMSLQSNALAPFLKRGLGADEFFYGLLMFTWAMAEVPLFFLSSHVVKKHGWKVLILVSYMFLLVKVSVYSFLITPAWLVLAIPVQVLNTFGISYPAKSYAVTNEIAPDRKALGMTLAQTFNVAGNFIGGLIGMYLGIVLGSAADTINGYKHVFSFAIAFCLCAIAVFIVLATIERVRSSKENAVQATSVKKE